MKKPLYLLQLLFFIFFSIENGTTQCTVSQTHINGGSAGAQSFTATCGGLLNSLTVSVHPATHATNTDLEIRDSNCEPIWTIENIGIAPNSQQTFNMNNGSGLSRILEADQLYSFHFVNSNGRLILRGSSVSGYSEGSSITNQCSNIDSYDHWFEIEIEPLSFVVWNEQQPNCLELNTQENRISKVSGGIAWNCGISSVNHLPRNQEGFVKMYIDFTKHQLMVGLSNEDIDEGYASIKYGIALQQSTYDRMQLNIFEEGENLGKKATIYIYDEVVINRTAEGKIEYLVNDQLIYTSLKTENECLIVDTSLKTVGAQLPNLTLSKNWITKPNSSGCK